MQASLSYPYLYPFPAYRLLASTPVGLLYAAFIHVTDRGHDEKKAEHDIEFEAPLGIELIPLAGGELPRTDRCLSPLSLLV